MSNEVETKLFGGNTFVLTHRDEEFQCWAGACDRRAIQVIEYRQEGFWMVTVYKEGDSIGDDVIPLESATAFSESDVSDLVINLKMVIRSLGFFVKADNVKH